MDTNATVSIGRRVPYAGRVARLTNFYPTYDEANDQVDAVSPVRGVLFQRVVPRYRLSTSETRDEGVGPAFITIPYAEATEVRRTAHPASPESLRAPVFSERGILVDIYV